ncbi:hypothetical protein, conserved [Eimeria tenella]|uniref:Kinesin motor domain-containing protein n=1 Tax=Eimeria tenella TaxID=5802 RepID=U6L096_EIMTE|nr:hypothetical protein, conserved [Eimeria tenella]CDJ42608.1 hypothetical protein, conserved [Eimeria tenella]|eukprot:XP_013233358.1 hypothetical protein, conserved [Eimeria tenella]
MRSKIFIVQKVSQPCECLAALRRCSVSQKMQLTSGRRSLCFGSLVKQEERRRGEGTANTNGMGVAGADVPIPYRYSNLTRILAGSLHSDASIVLLVTINPASTATQLSLHAIDFAQRASCLRERPIKIGTTTTKQFLLKQHELLKE